MVYTLGESLIDIIFDNGDNITSSPGGAMLNVATTLGRLGIDVALITEIGDDEVGNRIESFLDRNQVVCKYLRRYENLPTSLALAFLDERKVPGYTFHKSYPEKRQLVLPKVLTENDIVVFGSIYSLDPKIRKFISEFLTSARKANSIIIYDPNIRHSHHLKDDDKKRYLFENISLASIVKGSDEDFENIFGSSDTDFVFRKIREINTETKLIITRGKQGAELIDENFAVKIDAPKAKVVSTVGAGDNFTAGLVYYFKRTIIDNNKLKKMNLNNWEESIKMANKFASRVCSLYGNYIDDEFANEFLSH